MRPDQEPQWLKDARTNGLHITEQGVDMAKMNYPIQQRETPLAPTNGKAKESVDSRPVDASQNDKPKKAKPVQHEAKFQDMVIKAARLGGWRVAHFRPMKGVRPDGTFFHMTPVAADGKGFPDLVLLRGTVVIAAELKSKTGRRGPEQVAWMDAFKAAHVLTFWWTLEDWTEIAKVLR